MDGAEYCDECGTKLGGPINTSVGSLKQSYTPPPPPQFITQVAPPPPSFTKDSITPKPATPYTPPPPPPVSPPVNLTANPSPGPSGGQSAEGHLSGKAGSPLPPPPMIPNRPANNPQNVVQPQGQPPRPQTPGQFPAGHTMSINGQTTGLRGGGQRGGKIGKEFPLTSPESMIGRWDADGGIFPDVDLDQDDPEAKVSRRHARIQFLNNQYLIEDLGSTNGTFINRGPRLLPGNKQPLNNGDEIIVGKTFLKFILS
jgi:hypothetical protein